MIVLDHNIAHDQAQRLRRRRIHFRQVGFEVGRPEWDDHIDFQRDEFGGEPGHSADLLSP